MATGMITSVCWVPRGVAAARPRAMSPTPEERAAAAEHDERRGAGGDEDGDDDVEDDDDDGAMDDDDGGDDESDETARARAVAAAAAHTAGSLDAALAELAMETYDDDDAADAGRVFGARGGAMRDVAFASNRDDPYMSRRAGAADSDTDSGSGSEGDLVIGPGDLLLLAARSDEDAHSLEVWVYADGAESGDSALYVHHDILLPAFPLCVTWMDCAPGRSAGDKGHFAAVGCMGPGIEIFDCDVMDAVEPAGVLGGEFMEQPGEGGGDGDGGGAKKRGKKGKAGGAGSGAPRRRLRPGSHRDAVLALAWNGTFRNVLASGSADSTVKLWDVASCACDRTLSHHTGKVQALAWCPWDAAVLLSGGFDRTATLLDGRAPGAVPRVWALPADVESLAWLPAAGGGAGVGFLASTEGGEVVLFDARGGRGGKKGKAAAGGEGGDAVWRLAAHDRPVCTLALSPGGALATGSTDKTVKLWDPRGAGGPELLAAKNLKIGALFSVGFSPDEPLLLGAGGSKARHGKVAVWDLTTEAAVAERFPTAAGAPAG